MEELCKEKNKKYIYRKIICKLFLYVYVYVYTGKYICVYIYVYRYTFILYTWCDMVSMMHGANTSDLNSVF